MTVIVLGRDEVGVIAEDRDPAAPMRYYLYLTDCCGATAKGCDGYTGCRACYRPIPDAMGGTPGCELRRYPDGWKVVLTDLPPLVEPYGDGLPYDEWKARRAA